MSVCSKHAPIYDNFPINEEEVIDGPSITTINGRLHMGLLKGLQFIRPIYNENITDNYRLLGLKRIFENPQA